MGDSPYRSFDQSDEADRRAAYERAYIEEIRNAARTIEVKHAEQVKWKRDHKRIGDAVPSPDADSPKRDRVADKVAELFVRETLKEFAQRVVEIAADAHGLGPLLRAAEFGFKTLDWSEVAECDGTVEVSAPIPLGDGIDLEVSANLANGQDGPPFTVCCAPSDGWGVGVFQIGPFEVNPSPEHDRADSTSGHAGEANGWDPYGLNDLLYRSNQVRPRRWQSPESGDFGVEIISADLSMPGRVGSQPEGLAALECAARQELPQLRSRLRGRGTRLAILYDLKARRVLWLRLDEDGDPSLQIWRIRIVVDPATGRLGKVDVRQSG